MGINNTYTEFFQTSPTIQDLNVLVGNVSFISWINPITGSFGPQALTVSDTVSLPNANGNTSLTLGLIGNLPLTLTATNLSLQNGAKLTVQSGSQLNVTYFGSGLNGDLVIDGSSFNIVDPNFGSGHNIGAADGSGSLTLQNGAVANFSISGVGTTSWYGIAQDGSSATGSLSVTGGSTLAMHASLDIGSAGGNPTATLNVNGANSTLTQSDAHYISGIFVGSPENGVATINIGTTASGGTLTTGSAGLIINRTGTVNVGSAATTGTLNANGSVTIDGGALHVGSGSRFILAAGNTLTINGGTADFKSYTPNASQLNFIAGSLSYAGNFLVGTGGLLGESVTLDSTRQLSLTGTTSIDSTRELDIIGGALHTGAIVNNGRLVLVSGTLSTGTATLTAGGLLGVLLAGTTRNAQYGALMAGGSMNLAGELIVLTDTGFSPAVGNSFDILDWGTRTGTFSSVELSGLAAGQAWDTSQLYTTGVISVVAAAGVVGDYNGNGIVDAADYVAWRNNQGTAHVLPNDPIGGTIGTAQYNQWRAHFGQTAGSGSGARANTPVPEPATAALLVFAAIGLWLRRSRVE